MKFPDVEWLTTVCGLGKLSKCCRYLMCGSSGWECGKGTPEIREEIDRKVKAGEFNARGDNCDGPSASPRIMN